MIPMIAPTDVKALDTISPDDKKMERQSRDFLAVFLGKIYGPLFDRSGISTSWDGNDFEESGQASGYSRLTSSLSQTEIGAILAQDKGFESFVQDFKVSLLKMQKNGGYNAHKSHS
ncbi:hypothetical protein Bealeia1_00271 [Candidatus Bealeia paramacronuclearis]|uniref:Uncharacterized protein n=2 Tax=Candidatus Bealeia paramacronuclearis TaxID=1921001 RepID=A0ABZ2C152_9PROT|nr:hypothetical protein [Candidatus Bealeia paramacronuclearis]